jgi:hypothetical protein
VLGAIDVSYTRPTARPPQQTVQVDDMKNQTADDVVTDPGQPIVAEPTDAEIEEWATRERARREAWLNGPSPEERAEFARQERRRRLTGATGEREFVAERLFWKIGSYGRETQLAAEGAASLLYRWSRRSLDELVQAGRDWEEHALESIDRRRIPMDDEDA